MHTCRRPPQPVPDRAAHPLDAVAAAERRRRGAASRQRGRRLLQRRLPHRHRLFHRHGELHTHSRRCVVQTPALSLLLEVLAATSACPRQTRPASQSAALVQYTFPALFSSFDPSFQLQRPAASSLSLWQHSPRRRNLREPPVSLWPVFNAGKDIIADEVVYGCSCFSG